MTYDRTLSTANPPAFVLKIIAAPWTEYANIGAELPFLQSLQSRFLLFNGFKNSAIISEFIEATSYAGKIWNESSIISTKSKETKQFI